MILSRLSLLADTQKMGQAFSKLMAQYNENEMVLKELKILGDDSKVFKLVGPVLLSQVCVEPVICLAWTVFSDVAAELGSCN